MSDHSLDLLPCPCGGLILRDAPPMENIEGKAGVAASMIKDYPVRKGRIFFLIFWFTFLNRYVIFEYTH